MSFRSSCPNRFLGQCFMHGMGFGRWRWSRSMRSRPIDNGCGSCVCTALRPKVEIRCFPDVAPVKSQSKSCVVVGTENADETTPQRNHQLRVRESWRYDWVCVKTFQHCDISSRRTRPPPHRSKPPIYRKRSLPGNFCVEGEACTMHILKQSTLQCNATSHTRGQTCSSTRRNGSVGTFSLGKCIRWKR
jgi:hypothetical protein